MELERVGVFRTSNSDLVQFIIGALESDDVYLYHVENKKDSREFTISIYENKSKKIKKIIGGININDPDSILGDYLERKDEEIKAVLDNSEITLKQNDSSLQITSNEVDIIDRGSHKKHFATCPSCGKEFNSLLDLCEQCDVNSNRTGFACDDCGADIFIDGFIDGGTTTYD